MEIYWRAGIIGNDRQIDHPENNSTEKPQNDPINLSAFIMQNKMDKSFLEDAKLLDSLNLLDK